MLIAGIVAKLFNEFTVGVLSALLMLTVLAFAKLLPRTLGGDCCETFHPYVAHPICWTRQARQQLNPISNLAVRLFSRGTRDLNYTITPPHTVVTALRRNPSVSDVVRKFRSQPFGRLQVYGANSDSIVGRMRQRYLPKAKSNDQDCVLVKPLRGYAHFSSETVAMAQGLQLSLNMNTQMRIVVDEFGATAGVLTIKGIIEHILGGEIFEENKRPVDVRELA